MAAVATEDSNEVGLIRAQLATERRHATQVAAACVAALEDSATVLETLELTSFCLSCHSHEAFIKPEYEASSHFRNEVGVRAACADCHLPHDNWFELMFTKVVVSKDVIGEAMGKISTQEKYAAHRGAMAQTVWRQLLANGSKFCKSCHSFDAMDFSAQGGAPARQHKKAIQEGMSCVECHRGIVHKLPDNADALWAEVAPKP